MKRTFQIDNHPEKVNLILSSLRTDNHLSKTFEGTAKNGSLVGFYTNLALINGLVIGYVKVKGQYDSKKGDLKLEIVPSNLFWFVISFAVIVISVLAYKGLKGENMFFIGSFLFAFMALVWTLAFFLEGRSFIRHMHRIVESWL
ncbi:MAG: hypothetical protein HWE22_07855 [Flavobacteriales bacterium]|nr:hypothetical protein [Flavobacteriales bacterium]